MTATLTGCNDEEFTCRNLFTKKNFKFSIGNDFYSPIICLARHLSTLSIHQFSVKCLMFREGFCVSMEQRCDGVVHCRDKSDEVGRSSSLCRQTNKNYKQTNIQTYKNTNRQIQKTDKHTNRQIEKINRLGAASW